MKDYTIFADSSCDMPTEVLENWGIRYRSLYFHFDSEEKEYRNDEMPAAEFYQALRSGKTVKTAAVNFADFMEAFEELLKQGNDILYIGFSGGLSTTCHCAEMAAAELKESYPDRRIRIVDSLSASAGYGLLLYLTKQKQIEGASLDEAADYAESMKGKICHWFTVDELNYLVRGGRVASVVANVGGRLNLKPIIHMDKTGHLIPVSVARGRKKSLQALAEQYGKLAVEKARGPVYICHGDCAGDAEFLKNSLKETYGVNTDRIVDVGPVIGGHTGPGVVSLFFIGRER